MKKAYLLLTITLLLAVGCKSTHPSSSTKATADRLIFSDLLKQAKGYHFFQAKSTVELRSSGGNFTAKSTVKMVKDSLISISVHPVLGIEVVRLMVTRDSMFVVDKINRTYVAEALPAQENVAPLLGVLQSLLLNRLYLAGTKPTENDYKHFSYAAQPSGGYQLTTQEAAAKITYTLSSAHRISSAILSYTPALPTLHWTYRDIDPSATTPPKQTIQLEGAGMALTLDLSYQSVVWDQPIQATFSYPRNYARVEMSDILHLLK